MEKKLERAESEKLAIAAERDAAVAARDKVSEEYQTALSEQGSSQEQIRQAEQDRDRAVQEKNEVKTGLEAILMQAFSTVMLKPWTNILGTCV